MKNSAFVAASVPMVILSLVAVCCCSNLPYVDLSYVMGPSYGLGDEELLPFRAMYEIDRESRCLEAIDPSAEVRIERDPSGSRGYNAMLHLYSDSESRTVAFVWENGEYVWIGEQEVHRSGRTYMTVDGEAEEQIIVNYTEREFQGSGPAGLFIMYNGPDTNMPFLLTCEQAREYIREWEPEKASP